MSEKYNLKNELIEMYEEIDKKGNLTETEVNNYEFKLQLLKEMENISKTENVIADAMNVLITALKEDKEPGSYYHGWMCNLACKIFDNCSNKLSMEECNTIATKWLDFLISIPRNESEEKE